MLRLGVLWFLLSSSTHAFAQQTPNIIVILADDLGYSDLGCYGSEIQTPNLDRLAREGVQFARFYNNARCCPSRAALMTGVYPHQAGVGAMTDTAIPIPEYQGFLNSSVVTMATVLKDAGYATFLSGKWHLGHTPEHWPNKRGFQHCFAFLNGAASYFDFKPYRSDNWPPGNQLIVVKDDTPIQIEDDFYATDLYTEKAMEMLKNRVRGKPFFLYLSYTAPHWPLHALPEDISKYRGVYDQGWDQVRKARFKRQQQLGIMEQTTLSEKSDPERNWDELDPAQKRRKASLMEVYAAMVDRMDQNIGVLLGFLRDQEVLDNTAIFFLSDNGASTAGNMVFSKYTHSRFSPEAAPGTPESFGGYGNHWANVSNTPFRFAKSRVHQGGIASPFIAWFPRKYQPRLSFQQSHITDLMPTLVSLSGAAYPQEYSGKPIKPLQGVDLNPVLNQGAEMAIRPLYFEHMSNAGLLFGDWKLVRHRGKPWELYHLAMDGSETLDLSKNHPEKLNELIEMFNSWTSKNNILPWEKVIITSPYKF